MGWGLATRTYLRLRKCIGPERPWGVCGCGSSGTVRGRETWGKAEEWQKKWQKKKKEWRKPLCASDSREKTVQVKCLYSRCFWRSKGHRVVRKLNMILCFSLCLAHSDMPNCFKKISHLSSMIHILFRGDYSAGDGSQVLSKVSKPSVQVDSWTVGI